MKKVIFYFFAVAFLLTGSTVLVKAQEKVNCIIVQTNDGKTNEIKLSTVIRQYIEGDNWVFELKDSNQKLSYALEQLLPFKIELRDQTGIQTFQTQREWTVYDDGNDLIISVPDGIIGNYSVYDIYGCLLKKEYESNNKAIVTVSSGGMYIVKIDESVKKIVKR